MDLDYNELMEVEAVHSVQMDLEQLWIWMPQIEMW
jgi:hypothetical protein